MNKKISKCLFFLSNNSRITTQELSKKLRTSQQSASYIVTQLKKKKIIQDINTIVDPIKLGFTNILVGINYLNFDHKIKKDIVNELKRENSIISIQEASQGVDLIIEYCVSNLSYFNKLHSELVHKLSDQIETKFIFPVVVKHRFERSYLVSGKSNQQDIVICGDRETRNLNEKEEMILKELIKGPDITFTKLSHKAKVSAKTAVNIKRKLETTKLIRGYSAILNYKKLNIHRQLVFLNLSGRGIGEMNKLVQTAITNKNIIELVKIIGEYQVIITIESMQPIQIINDLRSEFSIKEYLIVDIENIVKKQYIPSNL